MSFSSVLSTRLYCENDDDWEPFYGDVEKILHSKAYARYADKTQVVYLFHHDHIAYRGLHVQLVSSLARSIGKRLGLSVDLIEAISLGHDIGHAPFGHEGEKYLNEISQEVGLGVFSHARQSCRVANEIELLNLTLATLDGFLCHDGGMKERIHKTCLNKTWEDHISEVEKRLQDLSGEIVPATREAALVKICDTISYLERDLEDALTLGIITKEEIPQSLFQSQSRVMTKILIKDVIDIYEATGCIGLSEGVFSSLKELRAFNYERIYFNAGLKGESEKIRTAYQLLFKKMQQEWEKKGRESLLWTHFLHNKQKSYIEKYSPEQHIVDYIAGMTDGYFLRLFQQLFIPNTIKVRNVLPFS